MNDATKILISLPALYGGGAERLVLNLVRHLDRTAFNPTLFLMKRQGAYLEEVPRDVRVMTGMERDDRVRRALPKVAWRYLRAAREHDVLLAGLELDTTYLSYLAGRVLSKPVVGWVHIALSEYLKRMPRWHGKAVGHVYPSLDRIICVSEGSAAALRAVADVASDRIRVMSGPFDLEIPVRRAVGLPPWSIEGVGRPVVVAMGRLHIQKGFDVLLRAHKMALLAGADHCLWILGEGPLRAELTALVEKLNITGSVKMPGFLSNPYPALQHAAVFVMSSRFEGLPVVLFEALALGIPCLSTDCPSGPAEILDKGRYGLLTPVEDERALANALCCLLHDPDLRARLSKAGPDRAARYSLRLTMPMWHKLFEELLPDKRAVAH